MTAQWIVNVAGVTAIAWIVWYFWLYRRESADAALVGGAQQVDVTVKGGYTPDLITVTAGTPVRLNFTRRESSLCSEVVVFDGIGRSARLPEGETVAIEFTPEAPGEIPFQCQMGMLRGRIVVTPPAR